MPQPMAARMIRKQSAAMTMPTGFPPMRVSESAPSAVRVLPPSEREYRPTANNAGRPAPATRPNTRIFQIAVRLIQDIFCFLLAQAAAGSGVDSAGATDPVHSAFTLLGSTLLPRDRQ